MIKTRAVRRDDVYIYFNYIKQENSVRCGILDSLFNRLEKMKSWSAFRKGQLEQKRQPPRPDEKENSSIVAKSRRECMLARCHFDGPISIQPKKLSC